VGPRATPQPADADINAILASVTGSLFADIDAKAAFWQRPRYLPPPRYPTPVAPVADASADITPMLDAFRLAYTNLQEIWSLVLPPNSLLGLKRLYVLEVGAFRMPDSLWARIVFDFLVAYRLRTINRGHLLGALIPLYLAWVASHINVTASGTNPERHIEAVAAAFEADKPYLVSRWRWPDRFNP
jgi:glucosylglycerate synthase